MAPLPRGRGAHDFLDQPRCHPRARAEARRKRPVSLRSLQGNKALRHAVGMAVTRTRFGAALFFTLAVAPGLVRAAAADSIESRIERHGEYITVNASVPVSYTHLTLPTSDL